MTIPHLNELKSWFRSGKDTHEIATAFRCEESEVYNLLDQARKAGQHWNTGTKSKERGQKQGARIASIVNRKKPVTLAPVSILRGTP